MELYLNVCWWHVHLTTCHLHLYEGPDYEDDQSESAGVLLERGCLGDLILFVLDEVVEKGPDYEDDQSESAGVLLERAVDHPRLLFCERFLELLIDLLSQLPTRRFFRPVVDDMAVAARCRLSRLYRHQRGRLFVQLVDLLRFYARFQMDDHAGRQLDEEEVDREHCARVSALQLFLFNKVPEDEEEVDREHYAWVSALQLFLFNRVPELRDVALTNVGSVEHADDLRDVALTNVGSVEHADGVRKWMGRLTDEQLAELVLNKLKLLSRAGLPYWPNTNLPPPPLPPFPLPALLPLSTTVQLKLLSQAGLPYRPPRHLLSSTRRPKAPTRMVVEEGSEEQQQEQQEEEEEAEQQYWEQQRAVLFHRLRPFLEEVVVSFFEKKRSQRAALNALPLYPNEDVMWDESLIPSVNYTGEGCLALPKLNLQFLTLHDYLLRNFNLFRLESTYEIREEVHDVLKRMGAKGSMYSSVDRDTEFTGCGRCCCGTGGGAGEREAGEDGAEEEEAAADAAAVVSSLSVPQRYGLRYVRGCEVIELRDEDNKLMNDFSGRVKREEWKPPKGNKRTALVALDPAQFQLDLEANGGTLRGAQEEVYSALNVVMRRKPKENNFKPILESIRDLMNEEASVPGWLHDLFLGYDDPAAASWRRMPAELAPWRVEVVDFRDTFVDAEHLKECFPGFKVRFVDADGFENPDPQPPFRVTIPMPKAQEEGRGVAMGGKKKGQEKEGKGKGKGKKGAKGKKKGKGKGGEEEKGGEKEKQEGEQMEVDGEKVKEGDGGDEAPQQGEQGDKGEQGGQEEGEGWWNAIISGVQPGLTMIVGPPGTGKTDTAVQILQVLYHNCPEQRTLVITHSNQALNDLFEKIMQRDVRAHYMLCLGMGAELSSPSLLITPLVPHPPLHPLLISSRDVPARYMLRLGMGEQELDTEQKFSRMGRVNDMLARRLELLAEVERLAVTLGRPSDVAYTCESAPTSGCCTCSPGGRHLWPSEAPGFKMTGASYAQDMRMAESCFEFLKGMFQELEECRAFELFKTTADRSNYLMARQAKVVAMTCTHAALKRRDFLNLGFHFDNLLMEESAQILEIETFIPMLLQRPDGPSCTVAGTGTGTAAASAAGAAAAGGSSGAGGGNGALSYSRLKRCILIGDHNQLPPVVKNMAFQKYSRMDQSLFTRFVRLGVPYIELNAQGRARPSIAQLYNWRYRDLGDLPVVKTGEEYVRANGGFAWEYQLVDVGDWMGRGESEPNPWFYQNLGEAEYVVSVFQYMRLLGYPAEKISILTTYNGQKHLIRDVIERRCAGNPRFGRPSKVTTVDRFQGQQNDYILLSLVRTRTVGHLRDVRRLVVAMSRARLGLYCFCRRALFEQCYELQPTFQLLLQRPDRLGLVLEEGSARTGRAAGEGSEGAYLVPGIEEMARMVEWRLQNVTEQVRRRGMGCE
ncbi:unnamed protein product [Closterium sp. NIES-65]|nr:unnamed protein product [Closterium sp. NIES-65]